MNLPEYRPIRAADAWRTVLNTGRDPEGYYILHRDLLPKLRSQELIEIARDIAAKRHRLAELQRENRARKNGPEDARRILHQTERCLLTLKKLAADRRYLLSRGLR